MSSQPETTMKPPSLPAQRVAEAVRTIAVVQSNYIPWKGYFDLVNMVDEFILFDDVQYTRRDWRNRNKIKTARGPEWLSIPVNSKGNYLAPIKDITVSDEGWGRRHWSALVANYGKAPHFKTYKDRFEEAYLGGGERRLSAINRRFLDLVCELLGIRTRLTWSMDYAVAAGKTERLVSICQQAGAGWRLVLWIAPLHRCRVPGLCGSAGSGPHALQREGRSGCLGGSSASKLGSFITAMEKRHEHPLTQGQGQHRRVAVAL